jgi:CBS domain containing-hemolysin-like protein
MEPTQTGPILGGLASIVLLVLANAFFVAAEFALVGARRTRLEEMIRAGDRKAILARRALQSLDRYISATQLGITLASLGLGWVGEPALAHLIEGVFRALPDRLEALATHTVAVAVAFSVISALHIILGELVPKALALLFPEKISAWVAAPLIGFAWVMTIPIGFLNGTANRLLRLLGVEAQSEKERLHSPEEIRMLVEQSQEGGSMLVQDARMLEGVFEFSEKTAEEVMTPRTQVVALRSDLSAAAAADVVAEAGRSRYPVYAGSLDEIIGVVHAKDILAALRRDPTVSLETLIRPPLLVPGTREVEDVLTDMKRLKSHMAVVLDEYGGTAGLVTMEDLLEEIVGEIQDEYDRVEKAAPAEPDPARLAGELTIADFNAEHDLELDDTDYTTVGGWVFGQLGRLPRVGDKVAAGPLTLEVAEMAGRRVKSLRVVGERGAG